MSRQLRSQNDSDESEGVSDENEDDFLSHEDESEEESEEEEINQTEEVDANLLIPSDEDGDDSDDAPDDVGFNASKNLAIKQIKDAINVLKSEKASTKNKRKLKNELFEKQKKIKLAELEKSKLPGDILEAVSGKSMRRTKKSLVEDEEVYKNSRIKFVDEEDEDNLLSKKVEFIPLNSSKGLVVKSVKSANKQISDTAKEFKNNSLYGGRIKRIDASALERQRAKRQARYL